MPEHIYFELQTGIVKDRPFRSNFYIYRLPASCLAKVELAVSEAGLTSSGLYYSPEFIEWLTKKDTKWNQTKGLPVPFEHRMKFPTMSNGDLYKYSSVGMYPLFYLDGHDEVLCRDCAQESLDAECVKDRPVACEVNWEDPSLFCVACGERIESAYADEEEP